MENRKFFTYPMKRKLVFLFFVFICGLAFLTVRIYSIVISEGAKYEKKRVLSQQVNNRIRYNQLIDLKEGQSLIAMVGFCREQKKGVSYYI